MSAANATTKEALQTEKQGKKNVLIIGCGYLGIRVAKACQSRGDDVWVSTRSTKRADFFKDQGLHPLVLDWTKRRTMANLPAVDFVLVAVSYDRQSPISRYDSQVGGFRNLLMCLNKEADICYISTTGVYHQTDGRWVDEVSPTNPSREGGRVHLQAEQLLHRMRPSSPWTIMRLAGIYGPGRVPRAADVIAGRPIQSPPGGYLNLIHVDDAASAVLANWNNQSDRERLYVVADDQPIPRKEFYSEIARQTGSSLPSFTAPPDKAPVKMRSESNKRIWNRRLKRDLLPRLSYPTYKSGLANVLNPG